MMMMIAGAYGDTDWIYRMMQTRKGSVLRVTDEHDLGIASHPKGARVDRETRRQYGWEVMIGIAVGVASMRYKLFALLGVALLFL